MNKSGGNGGASISGEVCIKSSSDGPAAAEEVAVNRLLLRRLRWRRLKHLKSGECVLEKKKK